MLPSIVSQLVVILKDSALAFRILYPELVRSGQTLAASKGNLIPTLIVIAAIYIVTTIATSLPAIWSGGCRPPGGDPGRHLSRPDAQSRAGSGHRNGGRAGGGVESGLAGGLGGAGLPDHDHLVSELGRSAQLLDFLGDIAGQNPWASMSSTTSGATITRISRPACMANPLSTPSRPGRSPPAVPVAARRPRCSPAGHRVDYR